LDLAKCWASPTGDKIGATRAFDLDDGLSVGSLAPVQSRCDQGGPCGRGHKLPCNISLNKVTCRVVDPVIADSARKRSIADEDILHAFRNPIFVFDLDDGLVMVTGPDRSHQLIEVGYVIADDGTPVIVHAMRPARPKFIRR
jgi:hypothetical protein